MNVGRAVLLRDPVLVGSAGFVAMAALHLRDPHVEGSWGFCPFQRLTGLPCPGCGGLRAVNDLSNGDVAGALASNAMAVVLVVGAGMFWLAWFSQRVQGREGPVLSTRWATALAIALGAGFLAFGACRMTPWGAWLRP